MALIVAGVFLGAQLVIDDHDRKQLDQQQLAGDQAAIVEASHPTHNYIHVIHVRGSAGGAGRVE